MARAKKPKEGSSTEGTLEQEVVEYLMPGGTILESIVVDGDFVSFDKEDGTTYKLHKRDLKVKK